MRINIGVMLLTIAIVGLVAFNIAGWDRTIFYMIFGFSLFNFDKYLGEERDGKRRKN